ncbi:hypothetical protein BDV18DRAFT_135103, partial [Aspergillus unguis]
MSPSPAFEASTPQARTKEENQERAFIAASRRKDRSLDARLESANRASQLHKRRTGRALAIDRDTVARELMYEEIDDTYRAKMQRYMRFQNAQLSQDFDDSLLSAFPTASHGLQLQMPPSLNMPMQSSSAQESAQSPHSASSEMKSSYISESPPAAPRNQMPRRPIAHHRPSSLKFNRPIHGARNMSIDLSQLRNTLPGPRTDSSAGVNFSPSYMTPDQPQAQAQVHAQAQVPSYVASDPFQQQQRLMQTWHSVFGQPVSVNAETWQPRPEHWPNGQFRNRMGSAPTISHTTTSAQTAGQTAGQIATPGPVPAPVRGSTQHVRVRSEPGLGLAAPTTPSSSSMSFQANFVTSSSNSRSTSPHTPVSPTSVSHSGGGGMNMSDSMGGNNVPATNTNLDMSGDAFKYTPPELQGFNFNFGFDLPNQDLADQDYLDFSQFASTLDHNQAFPYHLQMPMTDASGLGGLAGDAAFDTPDMTEYVA